MNVADDDPIERDTTVRCSPTNTEVKQSLFWLLLHGVRRAKCVDATSPGACVEAKVEGAAVRFGCTKKFRPFWTHLLEIVG